MLECEEWVGDGRQMGGRGGGELYCENAYPRIRAKAIKNRVEMREG